MPSESAAGIEVHAERFVRATPERAWQVLTDYERLPQFVANLASSRVISRNGHQLVLEQRGSGGLWFVRRKIHLVLDITEHPFSAIAVRRRSGDMQRYDARWALAPMQRDGCDGTQLRYAAVMQPDFFVPPIVGPALIQAETDQMLRAVLAEIERRYQK